MNKEKERRRCTVYLVQSLKVSELKEVAALFDEPLYVYDKRKILSWVESIIGRYDELRPEYKYKFYDKLARYIESGQKSN